MGDKKKYKAGVSKALLDLCAGSDLEKHRLAQRDMASTKEVIIGRNGEEEDAEKWLKSNKKNLT